MAKTRSMTRKRYNNVGGVPWSDLNHDLLLLVMMRLGVVDFVAFSAVCKSWRSIALCNKKTFMASKPPMSLCIFPCGRNGKKEGYFKDVEGRKYKILLPQSAGRTCVGFTCGYVILFGSKACDFLLVNLITRHELHFSDFPVEHVDTIPSYFKIRGVLVFSPSVSGWLFVVKKSGCSKIWFSIAGKGVWNYVSTTSYTYDLHAFKGKIYTINIDGVGGDVIGHLCEMRLGPEPKLMVLETKNFPKIDFIPRFVSYDENLYMVQYRSDYIYKVHKLDFDEMKWVLYFDEKTKIEEEFAFYRNHVGHITAAKQFQKSWASTYISGKGRVNAEYFWYFPHQCLNVDLID